MTQTYTDFLNYLNAPNAALTPGLVMNTTPIPHAWVMAKAAYTGARDHLRAASGHASGIVWRVPDAVQDEPAKPGVDIEAEWREGEANIAEREKQSANMRARIAAMQADLRQSIENANKPRRDLRRWYDVWGGGQKCDWRERDADLWRVASHEAAHCIVAIALGLTVESAIARRNGTGDMYVDQHSVNPIHTAAMLAAGTEADDANDFGRGSWHGQPGDDLTQFRETLAKLVNQYGQAASDTGHEASHARDLAVACLNCHARAHVAISVFLFDHVGQRVDGADIMRIFDFHENPQHADDRRHLDRFNAGEHYRGRSNYSFPG